MLNYLVEFLGTFLFLSVVVSTSNPLLISGALLTVILLIGKISGCHVNPAISVMLWAKGALSNQDLLGYVLAQITGGLAALAAFKSLVR
jgi:aquaporin Z